MVSMQIMPLPDIFKQQAVKQATGEDILSIEQLPGGISNETLAIKTTGGEDLILRTSKRPISRAFYIGEKKATELCASIGLPVPKVLSLSSFDVEGEIFYSSLETRLPGVGMSQYLKDNPGMQASLCEEAGVLLKEIHSFEADRFLFIDKRFIWSMPTVEKVLRDPWFNEETMLLVADAVSLHRDIIKLVFSEYYKLIENFPDIRPKLLHNDFYTHNILIHEGRISGIVDFELASGGDPIKEISNWDLHTKEKQSTRFLLKGWLGDDYLTPDFETRFNTWKIQIPLVCLRYFSEVDGETGLDGIKFNKELLIKLATEIENGSFSTSAEQVLR